MAIHNPVHINEGGLPLNAIEWLEKHHRGKAAERERMIRDLHLRRGSFLVDAGCGPGLWTPLLARSIGQQGRITGIDISPAALVTAQQHLQGTWYRHITQYKQGMLEDLPVLPGSADVIFSANVSQYLPDPVSTFASMGRYLKRGGRLAIKDIDFGTMRFHNIDLALQAKVFQAREQWEGARVDEGYAYEDSWVGSKLAGYLRNAGYEEVQERCYRIVRRSPISADFRFYLQGIAEWFVCEGAPYLDPSYRKQWLELFQEGEHCVLDQHDFYSEETEYIVTGVWTQSPMAQVRYFDMRVEMEMVV